MTKWTIEELRALKEIITKNGGPSMSAFRKAALELKKSPASCESKYSRVDWNNLVKMSYDNKDSSILSTPREWKRSENLKLYDLKVNKKLTYKEIAQILDRSPISCERQFQRNGSQSFFDNKSSIITEIQKAIEEEKVISVDKKQEVSREHKAKLTSRVVDWVVGIVKADPDNLRALEQQTFNAKLEKVFSNPDSHFSRSDVTIDFEGVKKLALQQIDDLGMAYPKTRTFGKGTYVVVGDSHGKNTPTGMFNLLVTINKTLKPDFIIHVGDISDDDDEISYEWKRIPNLIVIGSLHELHLLKKQIQKYDVVMKEVKLGNLSVTNQYDSGDFVKKSVGKIDPMTIPDLTIVNMHRHEMHSHCAYNKDRLIMSPGCLCRRHTIRTVKQLIFKDGYPTTRQTHPHGFRKYNKQEQDNARWEQGLIIVEVDENGKAYSTLCRIKTTRLGNTTTYCGNVYGENKVVKADQRIFFNGDMHCKLQDPNVLDIQEQFCLDYQPDVHVNIGDLLNNQGLSHHLGGTNGAAFFVNGNGRVEYTDSMDEVAASRFIMQRMRKWAPKSHLVIGNHERFTLDLAKKMPQLQDLISLKTLLDTENLGVEVTNLGHTLDLGCIKFIHGDVKVWGGVGGSKVDKVANNYGRDTVMGNIHYPAIRSGCYSVPMTGKLDQQYNEVDASQWMQGFGYADVFDGQAFITVVTIMNNQCVINGKTYTPGDVSSWNVPKHKIRIDINYS